MSHVDRIIGDEVDLTGVPLVCVYAMTSWSSFAGFELCYWESCSLFHLGVIFLPCHYIKVGFS